MKTEQVEDWNGRGPVIRIWSDCDASDGAEKDDVRTEFAPAAEAVDEWNAMQTSGASGYHGIPHEREQ